MRQITAGDTDSIFRVFGDPEVSRYWGHPRLEDRAAAKALVEQIRTGARRGDLLQWGITLAGTEDLIGTCTLLCSDRQHRRAELGVALEPAHQGNGYAAEAASAVIQDGFDQLGLHRITADVDPRNAPAIKLLERLGFREEGRLREHYRQNDEWQDGRLFGLLEPEWRAML